MADRDCRCNGSIWIAVAFACTMHDAERWVLRMAATILLLCTPSFGAASDVALSRYLLLEGFEAGRRIVVSVVSSLPTIAKRRSLPLLFRVKWGYSETPSGMPNDGDLVMLRRIDVDLEALFGNDAFLAMTRTANGGRTWFFYSSERVHLRTRLAQIFDAYPPISIRVTAEPDEAWAELEAVLNAVDRNHR